MLELVLQQGKCEYARVTVAVTNFGTQRGYQMSKIELNADSLQTADEP